MKKVISVLILIIVIAIETSVQAVTVVARQTIDSGTSTTQQTTDSSTSTSQQTSDEQSGTSTKWGDVIKQADDFLRDGKEDVIDTKGLKASSTDMFNAIFIIGVILAVGVGGYIGIKFMISSAEDKAQVKEMLLPYVAGCIVIFGAFGIWKLTVTILSNLD